MEISMHVDENNAKEGFVRDFFDSKIISFVFWLSVFSLFYFWIETFYFDNRINERISYQPNDGLPGWEISSAFGNHYFSDFRTIYSYSNEQNPWQFPTPYPPFAVFIFRLFHFMPLSVALILWTAVLAFSMLFPTIYAARGLKKIHKYFILFFLVIFTSPFISTLDRGNQIGIIPILIFFGLIAYKKNNKFSSILLLSCAISIKLTPALFIVYFLKKRDFKFSFQLILSTLVLNVLALLTWENQLQSFSDFLYQSARQQSDFFGTFSRGYPGVYGGFSMLTNIATGLGLSEATRFLYLIYLICFATLAGYIIIREKNENFLILYLLFMMQLVPLISNTYSRVWICVAIPWLLIQNVENVRRKKFWILIIFCTSVPLPIWVGNIDVLPTFGVLLLFCEIATTHFDFLAKRSTKHFFSKSRVARESF
jgi:hypothetical protein